MFFHSQNIIPIWSSLHRKGNSAIVADMPAKAMLRNSINFNGCYGCSQCDLKGFSVPSGAGHCRAYLLQGAEIVNARTHQSVMENAKMAEQEHIPVR